MKFELFNENKLNKIIKKDDTLVVCVSTGIDSMCLFHYLYTNGYNLVVAHVNHKRRVESDLEYEYLESLCKEKNIPFEGMEIKENITSNFQDEARKIRYDFFKKVATKYNTKYIALAHQADDELETILMRIIRGTSIKGYSGMQMVSKSDEFTLLRPLLETERSLIEKYQKEYGIKYFEDSSNNEDHYTRNIVRHSVIPTLKSLNPSIFDSIKNYSHDLKEMSDYIVKKSKEFIDNYSKKNIDEIIINLNDFLKLDIIVQKEVILESINYVSSNSVEIYHSKTEEILDQIYSSNKESKIIEVKGDIIFVKEYDNLVFTKKKTKKEIDLYLEREGEYLIDGFGKIVLSQKNHLLPSKNSYMLCYNIEDEIFPIHVRNVKMGDKITYSSITKKVYDLLKEYKVPKRLREFYLVFEHNDEIFFVPNIIRKETDKTKKNKMYITFLEAKDEN